MQAQVVFVKHNPKQVNGQRGPFTVHEFFTADNVKFETTKQDVANAAYALAIDGNGNPTNTTLLVTYDEQQNGQWVNRKMSAVQAAGAGAMAPGVLPSGSSTAPTGAAPATQTAAPTTGSSGAESTRYADHPDTARRIARSVGLELALKAVADGTITFDSKDQLYDVAHEFGAYVFNGSRPSSAAAGADSSGAGGGGVAGAAPAAPAPTVPAEPAPTAAPTADDDIPF